MKHPFSLKTYCCLLLTLLFWPALASSQGRETDGYSSHSKTEINQQIEKVEEALGISADSALALIDALIAQYQQQKNTYGLGRAKSFKAWILTFDARYENALRLGHDALRMQKKLNKDSMGIALTLNRIGVANMQFERYDDAREYFTTALVYFRELKDTSRMEAVLTNLGNVAYYEGDWQEAILYFKKSYKILQGGKEFEWIGYSLFNIAALYLEQDQLDSAEKYFNRSQSTFLGTGRDDVPPMVLLGLAELEEKKGNLTVALQYVQQAILQAKESDHTELIMSGQELLASLLYDTGQYEKAYDTQQEHKRVKAKTDSTNSAARVAEIEERYKNAEKEAHILKLQTKNLEVENRAQRSGLLALAALLAALAVAVVSGWAFWRRRQRHRVHSSQLQARIAETKLIALRAQMNPHFVYNCINTTQNFVLNSEKREAYDYLTKFARLLRMVLQNSDKTFIPLQDEIEQLRLYMHLEKTRFGNKFEYELQVASPLREGLYEIPGMILQPLVENAILHGLVNKEGQTGLLQLSFGLANGTVECNITDNGVGRQKAAEIKSRKKVHYQSIALPNVKERLQNLIGIDQKIQFEIMDLHQDGRPTGTRVQVHLPWR